MKKYSSKRSVQLLAHLLKEYGILDVVVSPGSRNAPLAIHFGEIEEFNSYSIVDERSAAFVALGMAKVQQKPVAITCTSGSAAANYYPAVTEAFYQNVPLLILSADRPSDYVDLFDGQTIRQKDLFSSHSYGDFQLLEDEVEGSEEQNFATIKTAIELCFEKQGPVHLNIPLNEPLYDLVGEIPVFPSVEKLAPARKFELSSPLVAEWNTSKRIMILVGTQPFSESLESSLSQLVKNHSVVVLCEVNSNLENPKFFHHIDRYLYNFDAQDYQTFAPDLLITLGQNVVSKRVKQFLRQASIAHHWHVDEFWHPDTYFSLTEYLKVAPEKFLQKLLNVVNLEPSAYYNLWDHLRRKKDIKHESYELATGYSDFRLFSLLAQKVPTHYDIHFSNSSAIRYAQLFDFSAHRVHCNRGTSGIDGCTSTAMGYAMKSENPTLLVTGDLGFFYDINALWNQYIPPYTRILIFNNGEGSIFKIIPGPDRANTDILEEFISTRHTKTAEHLAAHFEMDYTEVDDDQTLVRVLDLFFAPSTKPKILEVNTKEIANAQILRNYFTSLASDPKNDTTK